METEAIQKAIQKLVSSEETNKVPCLSPVISFLCEDRGSVWVTGESLRDMEQDIQEKFGLDEDETDRLLYPETDVSRDEVIKVLKIMESTNFVNWDAATDPNFVI